MLSKKIFLFAISVVILTLPTQNRAMNDDFFDLDDEFSNVYGDSQDDFSFQEDDSQSKQNIEELFGSSLSGYRTLAYFPAEL